MKPVDQRADRDCLQACIASIMEMDIDRIPDFGDEPGQWLRLDQFMAEEFLRPVGVPAGRFCVPFNAYYLMVGIGPRGLRHAVVGLNGKMVHDPHSSRAGLETIEHYILFVAFLHESEQGQ